MADTNGFRAVPCVCQGDLRRAQRIAAAGIPPRYVQHCTLDSFYERSSADLIRAKVRVREFVDCWPADKDGRGLILMGGPGTGKTHLAVAALLGIIQAGKPGKLLFVNFQDMLLEIQSSFGADFDLNAVQLLRPLREADLLVLDELGSQRPGKFSGDILYAIINGRYNEKRPTFFTTNYFDEPKLPGDQKLEDRIGRPLRSRLHEMTEVVPVRDVTDYRALNKQSRNTF